MFIWHVIQEKKGLKYFELISIPGAPSLPQLFCFFQNVFVKEKYDNKSCLIFLKNPFSVLFWQNGRKKLIFYFGTLIFEIKIFKKGWDKLLLLMEDFDKVVLTVLQQNRENLGIKKGQLAKMLSSRNQVLNFGNFTL